MYLKSQLSRTIIRIFLSVILLIVFVPPSANAQLRQLFFDQTEPPYNDVAGISFYSPNEGYVAFERYIGYTTDSGRSYQQKFITLGNVDYNGYSVNLTFGFDISGVHAFSRDTLVVYGHYAHVPAILFSSNGGNSFLLVYYTYLDVTNFSEGITDMVFPGNGNIGYAVEFDRIIKTTNRGRTWFAFRSDPNSFFDFIEGVDANTAFAFSVNHASELVKITGGNSSENILLPPGKLHYVHFISSTKGWLSAGENIYYTSNGGSAWTVKNLHSFECRKMKFINDSTGYAIDKNIVYKTVDSGKVWEKLPRFGNDVATYLNLFFWNANQFWAGGEYGLLDITTNGGGTPYPKAAFKVDTAGFFKTGKINLVNYSKIQYSHKWYKNDTLISTSFQTSYTRGTLPYLDRIKLVVSNGVNEDSVAFDQYFNPPVHIISFSPTEAASGHTVIIRGANLRNVNAVFFGATPAQSFSRVGDTEIRAIVANGASGSVRVVTPATGEFSLPGFTYVAPPTITGFTPAAAKAGTTVTITGTNFVAVTDVQFGGIKSPSFKVLSPTTLTATVPSGRSGKVMVINIADTAEADGFIALPTLSSFTPSGGTRGTPLKLTGTSLSETVSITVGGIPVTSFKVNSSTSVTAILGYGASGQVVLKTSGGADSMPGFSYVTPPSITSFSPMAAPVGSTVTIVGNNFDPIASGNVVYFGAVRGNVIGASPTSLTVTVPVGATYRPISVTTTTTRLTAFSTLPFIATFQGGNAITPKSFTKFIVPNPTRQFNGDIEVTDMDGDGKPDLMIVRNQVMFLRNSSINGIPSFDAEVNTGINVNPGQQIGSGDLDGDGKPDLVVVDPSATAILIYRNTSIPGTLSFAPYFLIPATGMTSFGLVDIDEDGKVDIVSGINGVTVHRNVSENENFEFIATTYSNLGNLLTVGDLDLDGKPDLVAKGYSPVGIIVAKNTSVSGAISFSGTAYPTSSVPEGAAIGDLDKDGWPDIVAPLFNQPAISIFRNKTNGGNLDFESAGQVFNRVNTDVINLGDLDGDGKPDLATKELLYTLSLFRNVSTPGSIEFAGKVDFDSTWTLGKAGIQLVDINGDGKPDPIVLGDTVKSVYIYINSASPKPYISGFTPAVGNNGTEVKITGVNFTGSTAVSFGGVPAASFTVNSDTSISAFVGAGATGKVAVTNTFGTDEREGFLYGSFITFTSFSPASGLVGTALTINGSGFSTNASENIVYVGGIRAVVTSASASSLTAIVPSGTGTQNISVTAKGLTAYSNVPFVVTFAGHPGRFTDSSFLPQPPLPARHSTLADINNDGKLDFVLLNSTHAFSVKLNTSSPGNLSTATQVNFDAGITSSKAIVGDLDGDGKTDVVVVNAAANSFSVFRNTTSGSTISFDAKKTYIIGPHTSPGGDIGIGDLDGDGRPEIVALNPESHVLSVFKNLGSIANIQFELVMEVNTPGLALEFKIADLDGDAKPELVTEAKTVYARITAFRNTSSMGQLSFANGEDIFLDLGYVSFTIADLNQDRLPEVLVTQENRFDFRMLKNVSTQGKISFATTSPNWYNYPNNIAVGDLDGDAKPDLAVLTSTELNLFKNTSTAGGQLSLDAVVPLSYYGSNNYTTMGDIDIDGVLDIVVSGNGNVIVSLNKPANGCSPVAPHVAIEATDSTICAGALVTFTATPTNGGSNPNYFWQIDGQNVANGSNKFTTGLIRSTATVRVIMHSNATCVSPLTDTSDLTIVVTGTVTPTVNLNASATTICPGSLVTFTATASNGGPNPTYQWQLNGINTGTNSNTFTTDAITTNSVVKVTMTSSADCASPVSATSSISINVSTLASPNVNLTASSTNICQGASVTFTATPQNGGTNPVYQWFVNGNSVGTNSNQYTTSTLTGISEVRVIMTSNAACVAVQKDTTILLVTVNPTVVPTVALTASAQVICPGTNVTFTATPTNQGSAPVYQWKKNGVNAGGNSPVYVVNTLVAGDSVTVTLTSNAGCASPTSVTSPAVRVAIDAGIDPVATITGNTEVNSGDLSVISVSVTNAGANPARQWQDSTSLHSWQDITGATSTSHTYQPASSGDRIRCKFSSTVCGVIKTVFSNTLEFNLLAGGKIAPNPVGDMLNIVELKLTDQWETVEIANLATGRTIIVKNIANQTKVSISVSQLSAGVYVAILKRSSGPPAHLRFIK